MRARLRADLFEAALQGEVEEVEEMIEAGASIESVDGSGRTALMKAAATGQAEVVTFLIGQEAELGRRDTGGANALMWACECEDEEGACDVAAALLDADGSAPMLDATDGVGLTVLMRAAQLGRSDLATCLIERGADSKLTDASTLTAVGHALAAAHGDVARRMVELGAWCDLSSACALGDEPLVQARLDETSGEGGAVNAADPRHGYTPLMAAAQGSSCELVTLLLDRRADLHATSTKGWDAMMWACSAGAEAVARLLLRSGAATHVVGADGATALSLAQRSGQPALCRLLDSEGIYLGA